ncbi:hypothetical protein [Pontibacter arcticus]|uniref:Uncharacterized protein n=1 Tax=Pontibacter arcticus TaxID=2080288 RepID=A0A364RDF9_9BACT|nr:hypothetical protein [Pontibacter arcticus]RAU82297.1 hypothetical protein DP923_10935 [Pontibacter arcticus]
MRRYETSEFRIDDTGIALLRSKFPYRRITYQEIGELQIQKGRVVNNHIAVLIMGITLIAAGLYISDIFNPIAVSETQLGYQGGKALGYFIFMILVFFCFGGILIYKSLKIDFVLVIKTEVFKKSYPLTELRKRRELGSFLIELREVVGNKLTTITRELI